MHGQNLGLVMKMFSANVDQHLDDKVNFENGEVDTDLKRTKVHEDHG